MHNARGMVALASLLCTLVWSPTVTYTDGTTVIGTIRYIVSYQPRKGAVQALADTDLTQLFLETCPVGTYWVQAYHLPDESDKSARSNTVTVKPGKGKP